MAAMLLWAMKNWKTTLTLVAVLILAVGLACERGRRQTVQRDYAEARVEIGQLKAKQLALEHRLTAVEELREREREVLNAALAKAKVRAATVDTIKKEIAHATPEDDGPVAPVLRNALDRLRDAARPAMGQ